MLDFLENTFVIKSMRYFVPDDGTNGAIIQSPALIKLNKHDN
jgi:hypothetical protein